jgi:hypothetical protein
MKRKNEIKSAAPQELYPFSRLIKLRTRENGMVVEEELRSFADTYLGIWDPEKEGHGVGQPRASLYDWRFPGPDRMSEGQLGWLMIGYTDDPVKHEQLIPGFMEKVQSVWSSGQCASLYLLVALATSLDHLLPEDELLLPLPIHKELHSIREPVIIILLSRFYRRLSAALLNSTRAVDKRVLQEHIVDLIRSAQRWQPLPEGAFYEINTLMELVENAVSKGRLEQHMATMEIDTRWPWQLGVYLVR